MKVKYEDFEVVIPTTDGMGIAEKRTIQVPLEWDDELEEWLLGKEAHRMIEDTRARYMGLVLPAQMKALREKLDLTQKEIGELLQIGEKTWTRWESGKHRPSRSVNLLIKALIDGEITVEYLRSRRHDGPDWRKVIPFEPKRSRRREPVVMYRLMKTHAKTNLEGTSPPSPGVELIEDQT